MEISWGTVMKFGGAAATATCGLAAASRLLGDGIAPRRGDCDDVTVPDMTFLLMFNHEVSIPV